MTQQQPCFVCLLDIPAESQEDPHEVWACSECHSVLHLRCVLQWSLRTVAEQENRTGVFSCPCCRARVALNSLPGMSTVRVPPPSDGAGFNTVNMRYHILQGSQRLPPTITITELLRGVFHHTASAAHEQEAEAEARSVESATQTDPAASSVPCVRIDANKIIYHIQKVIIR